MTTVFEYTKMAFVDSTLADAIYYNEKNYTLAIQFADSWRTHKPSVIYSGVPKDVYDALAASDSVGKTYNVSVKNKYVNLSGGTIYGVEYRSIEPEVADVATDSEKSVETESFEVYGYIRVSARIDAEDRKDAATKFAARLMDDGYDLDEIAVTEVTLTLE